MIMPEDINSRIVITVESLAAKQAIDSVTESLKQATEARERYLAVLKDTNQESAKTQKQTPVSTPPSDTKGISAQAKQNYDRLAGALDNVSQRLSELQSGLENINNRMAELQVRGDKANAKMSALPPNIGKVKIAIADVTDARERDLKIALAKSRMERAAYQSEIAAQKAYNKVKNTADYDIFPTSVPQTAQSCLQK